MGKLIKKIPEFVYRVLWRRIGRERDRKLERRFRLLYTGSQADMEKLVYSYRYRQISIVLLFCVCAAVLVLGAALGGKAAISAITIQRNTYGGGQKEESLVLENGTEIPFIVEERIYTEEEQEQAFKDSFIWVRENMLADNASVDEVRSNLNFMTEVPGGFEAEWVSESPEILDNEGNVWNQDWDLARSSMVYVQLYLSYREEEQCQMLCFCIREPEYTAEEKLVIRIKKLIQEKEAESREENSFEIPGIIEGVRLEQPGENRTYGLYILVGALFLFLFFYNENRMKDQGVKRVQQMEEDYPFLINKLVLYLGAGINLKKTFRQIVGEYQEDREKGKIQRRYMYEELLVMVNEMSAGEGEIAAYEAFAARMGSNAYSRLMSLLVQNLQKGNDGLLTALRTEETDSFFLRMDQAKKKAEEAGTKLLFPMLVMLLVVMVIVMAPALLQFGSF